MIRTFFGVPEDENNTYIDNLNCHSQTGVYTMDRQAMCGSSFLNVFVSLLKVIQMKTRVSIVDELSLSMLKFVSTFLKTLRFLQAYSGLPCTIGPDEATCVHIDVYVPLILESNNCCGINYLAMVKYQTSDNQFDVKFVPVDLYPSECNVYYIFSQVGLSSYAVLVASGIILVPGF